MLPVNRRRYALAFVGVVSERSAARTAQRSERTGGKIPRRRLALGDEVFTGVFIYSRTQSRRRLDARRRAAFTLTSTVSFGMVDS